MDYLTQYAEIKTWLAMVELSPLTIALCLLFAFIGAVVFGPYLSGRG